MKTNDDNDARRAWLRLMLSLALGAGGVMPASAAPPASCSSDGQNAPAALLERFINADCADCWSEEPPAPADDALALDWIAPGPLGDDGALSAAARADALERLQSLGRPLPQRTWSLNRMLRAAPAAGTPAPALRVALGLPVGNYIGTSIELRGSLAPGRWRAWLVLVETLPAGLEDSPVERNLVRNSLHLDWNVAPRTDPAAPAPAPAALRELRPMQIPAGAQAARLAVVGWIEEAREAPGQIAAIARSRCGE